MKYLHIILLLFGSFMLLRCDTSKKVSTTPIKADFVIQNVKLFDGNEVRENCNVALRTATSNTSKAFKIKEIGWIKTGGRATFSLINGDPTNSIEDLEKMEMVWQKGARLK